MTEEACNDRDNWREAIFVAASSAAEAAEETVTYHFPEIPLKAQDGCCRKNIRVLETETGEVSTWCVSYAWAPQAYNAERIDQDESETARG